MHLFHKKKNIDQKYPDLSENEVMDASVKELENDAADNKPDSAVREMQEVPEKEQAASTEKEQPGPLKKAAKKAAGVGAAGLAAFSLMIGSTFSSPAEVMNKANPDPERPAVIVEIQAEPDDVLEEIPEEEDEKKRTFRDMFRNFILKLPVAVRLLLILPLWVIGYAAIAALTALFEPVIAPILSVILKWVLIGGLLAAAFFLLKKAIAPDTPIREIFSKRNLVMIGIAAAVFGTADFFLKEYVEHYSFWRNIACGAAGAVLLAVFAARQLRKGKAAKPA